MAWESRGDNRYYYRKVWQDGQCQSVYLGSGEAAAMLADYDAKVQRAEEIARLIEQEHQQPAEAARKIVRGVAQDLRRLTTAVLIANGYHQHKRQWRKRMEQTRPAIGEVALMPVAPDPEEVRRGVDALAQALAIVPEATKKGRAAEQAEAQAEQERRAAVGRVLNQYPCIWPHLRKYISDGIDGLMVATGTPKDTTTGQVLLRAMKSMRTDLGYKDSPMLERLLIEHVVLTWLDYDTMQKYYALYAIREHTLTAGAYWDRRLNSAQQRHLRAVETLARVRRLAMATPLQVNIGGQQVIVAGGTA